MRLADLIFAVAGEVSQFQQSHGFSIDGADLTSSALPEGWRTRLVKVQNENTAAPRRPPAVHRLVLDKEDLCVAKLCAFREKDRNSVDALISDGLVDVRVIADRITTVLLRYSSNVERAAAWLAFRSNPDSRRVGGDSEPPLRDPRRSTIMLLRTVEGSWVDGVQRHQSRVRPQPALTPTRRTHWRRGRRIIEFPLGSGVKNRPLSQAVCSGFCSCIANLVALRPGTVFRELAKITLGAIYTTPHPGYARTN